MKGVGFLFGATASAVVRLIIKFVKATVEIVSTIIFYFGLYLPISYLIFGGVLVAIFDFALFGLSTESMLFILGFTLSCACAVIVAVKNLIVSPYRKHVKSTNVVDYNEKTRLGKNAPEAPKIYKSRVNPGVIVYEYANRFDLYEEYDDGLELVNTEYKTRNERRW